MTQKNIPRQSLFKPLLEDALQVLKGPFYNPDGDKFKAILYTIKNCDFFRNSFDCHVKLNEFAQLARFHVNYEALEYGSIIQREKEYVDKICIILDGTVEKIRQRPYGEIEQEVQKERKWKSLLEDEALSKALEFQKTNTETDEVVIPRAERPSFLTCVPKIPKKVQVAEDQLPQIEDKKLRCSIMLRHMKTEKIESSPKQGGGGSTIASSGEINEEDSPVFKGLKKMTTAMVNGRNTPNIFEDNTSTLHDLMGQESETRSLDSFKITKEDEKLLRAVASNDAEVKRTYFMENVLRAIKVNSYNSGEYFGESFCRASSLKSDSMYIVSSKQAHLLTLSKEDFLKIKTDLEKQDCEKTERLMQIFPSFSKKNVKEFSQYFCQKSFAKDEEIYSQGDLSKHTYLLISGEVKLFKDMSHLNQGQNMPVACVIKNQFFGEESLLDKEFRKFTAVVHSPSAVAYVLDQCFYEQIKLKFGSFFEVLKNQAVEKFFWREQRASELYETKTYVHMKPRLSCQIQINTPKKAGGKVSISRWADVPSPARMRPENISTTREDLSLSTFEGTPKSQSGHISPQFHVMRSYKSKYSRKTVIGTHHTVNNSDTNLSKSIQTNQIDFSPVQDLVGFNLRKELYAGKSPKSGDSPQKRRNKGKTQVELPSISSPVRTVLKLNSKPTKTENDERKMVVDSAKVKAVGRKLTMMGYNSPKMGKDEREVKTRVVNTSDGFLISNIQIQSGRVKGC